MTQNNPCELNSAILEAFRKHYLSFSPIKDPRLIKKVEDYVNRTVKPKIENPLYHKAAKSLLISLWQKTIAENVPQGSLKSLSKFEYKKRKNFAYHRDHIAHSASVFLLGLVLIDRCYEIKEAIFSWPKNNPLSKTQSIESWMWCATLHDLGYPAKKSSYLKEWDHLERFFRTNLTEYLKKPELKNQFLNNRKQKHGLASAAIALNIFYKCRNNSDCKNMTIKSFDHVIRAIAFHDEKYKQDFFRVGLKDDPYLFLLILCDELQCWNRPSKGMRPFIRSDFVSIGIDKINNKEKIQLRFKSYRDTEAKKKMLKKADKEIRNKLDMALIQLEVILNSRAIRPN